jgi:hypothetical protein
MAASDVKRREMEAKYTIRLAGRHGADGGYRLRGVSATLLGGYEPGGRSISVRSPP